MASKIYFENPQYSFKPSTDYYRTQQRFQEILEQKLNKHLGETRNVDFPEIFVGQPFNLCYTAEIDSGDGKLILFDPNNVTKESHVNQEFIDMKLKGTALEGLGEYFKKAEKKYGINALFLASLAAHESAMGASRIARDKNNLFGFGAYDRSPYESAKKFANKEEGIMEVAAYLSRHYLSEDGKYFNGYSVEDIGKRYATDPNWANALKSRMSKIFMK